MAHPKVLEAAVVAIPDDRWLERPLACVVLREPATSDELAGYLKERFAGWWVPNEYVFLPEIPKTGVGKFDKKALRAQFNEPAARAEGSGGAQDSPQATSGA